MENIGFGKKNAFYLKRAIWSTENKMDYVDGKKDYMLINIPSFLYLTNIVMDEIIWEYLLIRMKDPDDHATIDAL